MATITEDYVSFETAKLLKEKGFNEGCNRVYQGPNLKYTTIPISPLMALGELGGFHPKQLYVNNNELGDIVYTAPTLQIAMKWLREVHYLHITVHPGVSEYGFVWTYAIVFAKEVGKGETHFYKISQITTPIVKSKSYEQACEAAIKYCLEHLI